MKENDDKKKKTDQLFKTGHAKLGGRKKGTPNRVTILDNKLKSSLSKFSLDKFNDFIRAFDECQPYEKCKVYLSVVDYDIPKIQRITHENHPSDQQKEVIQTVSFGDGMVIGAMIRNPERTYTESEIIEKIKMEENDGSKEESE
jgi:hypothetical protein